MSEKAWSQVLVKEIKKVLQRAEDHYKDKQIIVLGNPDWRPALLGLVANSIAEEYGKPVFLWGREDGKYIKGSCRSDGRTDLTKIMGLSAKNLLSIIGGHKLSGGFSVDHEKIHELEDALLKAGARVYEWRKSRTGGCSYRCKTCNG
jgi:single-stranded DNA-specific DHH superfamily exonuclease